MILQITHKDAATLVLHMSVMRKNFKKLLKSKYKEQLDHYIESYDYVIGEAAYALENHIDKYDVHLNLNDLIVLKDFLRAYTDKVGAELQKAEKMETAVKRVRFEDKEQHEILCRVKNDCEELLKDVS